MKKLLRLLFGAALIAALSQPALAQYAVHDATANATLKLMSKTQNAQLAKATEQLAQVRQQVQQLNQLNNMIRSGNWQNLSPAQLGSVVGALPGMKGFDTKSLFGDNGYLNVFMGMSTRDYTTLVENPTGYASDYLMSRLGAVSDRNGNKVGGFTAGELLWAKRIGTRAANGGSAATSINDIADFLAARQLRQTAENNKRTQALAGAVGSIADQSSKDASEGKTTVTGGLATSAALQAKTAEAVLENTRVMNDHNTALQAQLNAEKALLENERIRRQAEREYATPGGE